MDLFTMIGACLRRWYVTAPLVVIACVAAYQAYEAVPSVYTTQTSIVVLPATEITVVDEDALPEPSNPYAGSGGPRFAATVLARNINTDAYRNRIGVTDPDITFDASAGSQQPIIRVEAFAPTPEQVLAVLDAVTASANDVLAGFQTEAGAPDAKLYRIAPAVPADRVEDVTPSRMRSAGAILAVGLVIAAGVGTGVDSLLRRRADRRSDLGPPPVEGSAGEGSPSGLATAPSAVEGTSDEHVPQPVPTPGPPANWHPAHHPGQRPAPADDDETRELPVVVAAQEGVRVPAQTVPARATELVDGPTQPVPFHER